MTPRCQLSTVDCRPDRVLAAFVLLATLGVQAALAHDFWIEPSTFRPAVPSQLTVALRVGQDFRGDPVPRDDRKIDRFVLADPAGESAIPGLPGTDPAGFVRIERPGLAVIGYRSRRTFIELEAEKFEKYLTDEGLERVSKARAERGESGKPGKEVYSRCAKSIVLAGGGPAAGYDRPLGFTLELVPEKLVAKPGDLPIRLLYEGRALEGALVVAINREEPEKRLSVRTGRDGRARLGLPRPGVWLVKVVHMVPAPKDTGADWESLWASLTFEIP
ncbi:MAG TPA: DUF4198 domain-containing protein [Thermoanaerobaculia bacterium]|jgi:uncharacterized GH25 family protein|nr:DUF4198 domain-containing protein [Thermoanaerobaculia bacterium]